MRSLVTVNVNGVRAAVRRGALRWLADADADVWCLQEVRASEQELAGALADTPFRHWHASPRPAVEFLIRAAMLDGQQVGPRRTLSMPGLSATVGEQIEALRRVAGEQAVRLIRREPDESIMRIVETWAPALEATRALRLGFAAENSFDEIIRVHIDDELGGIL